MSYARPTLAEFQAVFRGFGTVTQPQFDYWIDRAERVITDDFGDDQLHATQLLLAHYFVTQGLGDDVDSQLWAKFAGANSIKSGTLSLGWSADRAKRTTGSRYGDEVRAMLLALRGGPAVARTGTVVDEFCNLAYHGSNHGPA